MLLVSRKTAVSGNNTELSLENKDARTMITDLYNKSISRVRIRGLRLQFCSVRLAVSFVIILIHHQLCRVYVQVTMGKRSTTVHISGAIQYEVWNV